MSGTFISTFGLLLAWVWSFGICFIWLESPAYLQIITADTSDLEWANVLIINTYFDMNSVLVLHEPVA